MALPVSGKKVSVRQVIKSAIRIGAPLLYAPAPPTPRVATRNGRVGRYIRCLPAGGRVVLRTPCAARTGGALMPAPPAEFDGLAALVTGGASGIGLATARLLAARGGRVAILDRDIPWASGGPRAGQDEAGSPADAGALHPLVADVTDDQAVRAAVRAAAGALGGIDILVNNAGIGAAGTVEDNDDDEWRHVLDVNVLGAVRVSRAALPE